MLIVFVGKRPWQCPSCPKSFAVKNTLDQHMVTHDDLRPYLCDLCGFATKYQSHLTAHKRTHTGMMLSQLISIIYTFFSPLFSVDVDTCILLKQLRPVLNYNVFLSNRIGGVMVNMLTSSEVDRGFKPDWII